MYALWLKIHWSCMLLTIMYAVWTNIYIVMYVAVSHVRSNVKQNPIKSCPPCSFFTFFTFFQRREGPLQRSENVKKQQSGPVWIWLSQTTTIIMYVSFYNHVRREDKHYHILSSITYISREHWDLVSIIDVQSMVFANDRIHYGL